MTSTRRLLWIVDEAKNVKPEIFTGVDRCSYNAKLLSSSPGMKRGTFFDAFTKDKAQYVTVAAGLDGLPAHFPGQGEPHHCHLRRRSSLHSQFSVYGEFMDQDEVDKYILSRHRFAPLPR